MDVIGPGGIGPHRVLGQAEHRMQVVSETLAGTWAEAPVTEEAGQELPDPPCSEANRRTGLRGAVLASGYEAEAPPIWGTLVSPTGACVTWGRTQQLGWAAGPNPGSAAYQGHEPATPGQRSTSQPHSPAEPHATCDWRSPLTDALREQKPRRAAKTRGASRAGPPIHLPMGWAPNKQRLLPSEEPADSSYGGAGPPSCPSDKLSYRASRARGGAGGRRQQLGAATQAGRAVPRRTPVSSQRGDRAAESCPCCSVPRRARRGPVAGGCA